MLITLEGINGAGKTTLMPYIAKALEEHFEMPVILTREPGGSTSIGAEIRKLIFSNPSLEKSSQLALFYADRYAHISEVIKPALNMGKIVLCDRYIHSTFAFQGANFPVEDLMDYAKQHFVLPTATFYFNLPLSVAEERLKSKSNNHFDAWDVNMQAQRIYSSFSNRSIPAVKWIVVDASKTYEETLSQVVQGIKTLPKPKFITATMRSRILR